MEPKTGFPSALRKLIGVVIMFGTIGYASGLAWFQASVVAVTGG